MNRLSHFKLLLLVPCLLMGCSYEEPNLGGPYNSEEIGGSTADPSEDKGDEETTTPPVADGDVPFSSCGVFSEMVLDFESPLDVSAYNPYRGQIVDGQFVMIHPATAIGETFNPLSRGLESKNTFILGEGRLSLEISEIPLGSNIEMLLNVRSTLNGSTVVKLGKTEEQTYLQIRKANSNGFKGFSNERSRFYALNVSEYEISLEKSLDGENWVSLGTIPTGLEGPVTVELQSYQGKPSALSHVVYFDNVNLDCE